MTAERAAEIDTSGGSLESSSLYRECSECNGRNGGTCKACDGFGYVKDEISPEVFACVWEFLEARHAIESFGFNGWLSSLAVDGVRPDVDPLFLDALRTFEAEYRRLEHKEHVRRARRMKHQSRLKRSK